MRITIKRNSLLSVFILCAASFAFSQQWVVRSQEDGDPFFNPGRTSFEPGITDSIAGILQIAPQFQDTLHQADNTWKLDGIEWQYDIEKYNTSDAGYLKHASDVDDITSFMGEPTYLITDLNDNKVIIHNPNPVQLEPIWNLHPASYAGPSDSDFFREGEQNRVLVTYKTSHVVVKFSFGQSVLWTYGQLGTPGIGPNQLDSPSDAVKVTSLIDTTNAYLIADTGNNRVIIVDEQSKNIIWSFSGVDTLSAPVDVDYIAATDSNDKVLITDQTLHRVLIVNRATRQIEWSWGTGSPGSTLYELNNPSDADYVPATDHVLIADKGNNRILEINLSDSTVWSWPNPVPEVEDVDAYVPSGFLVVQKETIKGTGAVTWLPTVLRFTEAPHEIVSDIYQVDKSVNFTNIFWQADTLAAGTTIGFQFRSGIDFGDIAKNPWLGPDADTTSMYTTPGQELITKHKVHQLYQFKAILQTTNPRATPSVSQYGVRYSSYDTTATPLIFTRPIGPDSSEQVTVAWDSLIFRWSIPPEERNYKNDLDFRLSINNAETGQPVYTYRPNPYSDIDKIRLAEIPGLRGVKNIYLTLNLITHNTALSPRLDKWQVIWKQTETEPSVVEFVDENYESKPFYTAANYIPTPSDTVFVDHVYLKISNNISELEDVVPLTVSSSITQDVETSNLSLKIADVDFYGSDVGLPIIVVDNISDAVVGNDTLEVVDRDSLHVEYQSPQRPSEISADSILIVRGTVGVLSVENVNRQPIENAALGERLYLRVASETDRSLDPVLMDSLEVTLLNNNTRDQETVTLYELQADDGDYNTGEFISPDDAGILLRDDPSYLPEDGVLYTRLGDVVHAIYQDNFKRSPTLVYVSVPDSIRIQVAQPLLCEVAPNPYYASRDGNFRMRIASSIGTLTVTKIEVYNIAGEKVLQINGDNVSFPEWGGNSVGINRYGIIENWWNLLTDSGHQISSGTYWVKLQADVLQENSNVVEKLSTLTKFVVIR